MLLPLAGSCVCPRPGKLAFTAANLLIVDIFSLYLYGIQHKKYVTVHKFYSLNLRKDRG